jgi:ligand-binding SRPBCC domain-containing protein
MKLTIQTSVQQSYQQVWAGFTKDLFTKLSPPFPPVKVIRFDGCLKGDIVELELNFLVFKQSWKSLITDQQTTDVDIFFLDEGIKLPFFLSSWRHYHRIIKDSNSTIIADEIEFRTPTILTDYLLYPLLWAQFAYRKPIYRSVFNRKT